MGEGQKNQEKVAFPPSFLLTCSKSMENHCHAVALFYMWYNFVRIHQTLRITPAMEAGISHHVWSIQEIIVLATQSLKAAA